MRTLSSLHTFLILLIIICTIILGNSTDILPKNLQLISSPIITVTGQTENVPVCFADCESCQTSTGACQKCFAPWFQHSDGNCQLAFNQYTLESTAQEQRFNNFIPSSQWSFNGAPVNTKVCTPNPDNFTDSLTIIGPFSKGNVTYQRTISQHNYFTISLLLILTNWTDDTTLQIRITNQEDTLISDQILSLFTNEIKTAYKQQLCSNQLIDRRLSVTLQVNQQQTNQISIQFIGDMKKNATWSLSSFILVTGPCSSSCASCSGYTPLPNSCDICSNFLANNDTQKCSTCLNGFNLSTTQNRCYKCSIQLKQCNFNDPSRLNCQYSNITNVTQNCNFTTQVYFDNQFITQQLYFSSLFAIQNKGSNVYRCGVYSIVGPANFGDLITRNFQQLPLHVQLSINFNIFIFDQDQATQRYSIAIIVDGQPFPIQPSQETINITGTSNQCNLDPNNIKLDTLKTFQTQTFIKHKKSSNVVVGISLGTSIKNSYTKWGLRDVRLVYKRCDDGCINCTQNGCQACKGFFQLKDLQCKTCMVGTGLNAGGKACQPCIDNCMQCIVPNNSVNKSLVCTKCMSGYYQYTFKNVTTCQIYPTYGKPLGTSFSNNNNCSLTVPGTPIRTINFQIIQNRAIRTITFSNISSIGKNIQFYLMKIDNWQGDYLDIYINDLLVKRIQYGSQGKNFCGNQQGDQPSYQYFNIQDDNSTVTIEFQAVHKNITKARRFGVGNFRVFPIGCKDCQNYEFIYTVKYDYVETIFAQLAFNLVYINNNPEEFKNIFRLKAGQKVLDYNITANDSIKYWLKAQSIQKQEIINQKLTVQCLYPQRVTAQIPIAGQNNNTINTFQFFDKRVLQTAYNTNFQSTKILDNSTAQVQISRFSPLKDKQRSVLALQTFFSVMTRFVIYLGFASFFIGCQTSCTHVMHNFQKLWVHIYVATLALSPILKTALWGFRQAQDQNIAINSDQWQSGLPKYLYYDVPAAFQHYYKDITFFRHIYNIGVAFLILAIVFVIFHFIFQKYRSSQNIVLRHFSVTFYHRPLFYFNSIIFYQYFTLMIACCLQFLDLKTKTNQPVFAGINAAACIIAFLFATFYPIIFHIVLNKKRTPIKDLTKTIMNDNANKDFSSHRINLALLQQAVLRFNNKYEQIFSRFEPKNIWKQNLAQNQLFGHIHILYNVFRFGDLWWHAIITILLHHSPFAQTFLLIITNGFHLFLVIFSKLNNNKNFRICKSLQLLCFIVIEVMIIVMLNLLETLRFQSFQTLGIVAIIFIFFILASTLYRFFYTMYKIYGIYLLDDPRKVIRSDRGFGKNWHPDLENIHNQSNNYQKK